MINNIFENNKAYKTNTALTEMPAKAIKFVSRHRGDNNPAEILTANNENGHNRSESLQTTYTNGEWFNEIINGDNNTNEVKEIFHKQQYCSNANDKSHNIKGNTVNRNVWLSAINSSIPSEREKQQEEQKENLRTPSDNDCDIIVVDIEDADDDDNVTERQTHHSTLQYNNVPSKLLMNAEIKYATNNSTMGDSAGKVTQNEISWTVKNSGQPPSNGNSTNRPVNFMANGDEKIEDEDEDDSLASMETLSDNVSIWIDGEKHWVAGVDANTTCSELIWALLNYQSGQQVGQRQTHQQHENEVAAATTTSAVNGANEQELQTKQQQQPNICNKNVIEFNLSLARNEVNTDACEGQKPNYQTTASNENSDAATNVTSISANTPINQSMPINTKENYKIIQNSTNELTAATTTTTTTTTTATATVRATPSSSLAPVSEMTPPTTLVPPILPPGITTVSQLATEYVIVKQYPHCEEYLDGSTKVFDALPPRNGSNKKECELLLRHLGPSPALYINNTTPQLSSLISTDKDSGMGSPVGSARSAKFRRRKHKSSQWLAQANTLHPKLSRCMANERLMKIILAQDETIQRQLFLLREKERQISKIEEEKHRKRERELGKNYLLETYLNGLDEADCEPEIQHAEEIFIDEPPHHRTAVSFKGATATTNPRTVTAPTAAALAAGAITDKIPSALEALNTMVKHKLKNKEVKKEKKKKRHKEKHIKDEQIETEDFNLNTTKNKNKETLDTQQPIDGNIVKDNGNEQEIKLQIFWLEKIYALNKQLQKEEELAAKLNAKLRKHQLKKAEHTQREVQMEIDRLDNNLALQCGDIRKVEASLMQTNEQLQKKLLVLERLSLEYLREQQETETAKDQDDINENSGKQANILTFTAPDSKYTLKTDTNSLLTALEKSLDMQKLSLNNIKSKEEAIKMEKIIAKPGIDLRPAKAELKEIKQFVNNEPDNVTNIPARANAKGTFLQTNQRHTNATTTAAPAADNQQATQQQYYHNRNHHHHHHDLHHYHQQHPELTAIPAIALTAAGHTSPFSEGTKSNDTEASQSCMFVDKNILSSLHVQNAKTIKKQMFHTQTTQTTPAAAAAASLSPTWPQHLPPTQLPPITNEFSEQQFQHAMNKHMPLASTYLTSRPQNSHQIQATNVSMTQKQQPSATSSSCSSHLTTTTSSTLSSASGTANVLMVQYPPASTSPSPSIMAMNTVDISQLGTLV